MLKLERLILRNWATWDRADVDFSTTGLTYFRGYDVDTGGNPNGAGKSTLINSMYAVAFQDHQLAVRKKSLKQVLREDTKIDFRFSNGKYQHRLLQKGSNLSIFRDGQDVANRTKDSGRTEALGALGISPELWSTTIMVNGRMTNPIIAGTGADRAGFLERAFDLNRWEPKYRQVADIVTSSKRINKELADIQDRFQALPEPVDPQDLKDRIEASETKLAKYSKRLATIQRNIATLEALPPKPPKSSRFYERRQQELSTELNLIEKRAKRAAEYSNQRLARERYITTRNKLRATIKLAADIEYEATDLQDAIDTLRSDAKALSDWAKREPKIERFATAARKIAKAHKLSTKSIPDLALMAKTWVSTLKPDAKDCPVCGSELKLHLSTAQLEELAEALEDLPPNLNPPTTKRTLSKIKAKLQSFQEQLELVLQAKQAQRQLDLLEKVDDPGELPSNKAVSTKDISEELSAISTYIERAKRHEANEISDSLPDLETEQDELIKTIDKLNDRLPSLREQASNLAAQAALRTELSNRIETLQQELKLLPVYQALQLAYSPQGLRLDRIANFMDALISNLNQGSVHGKDSISYSYKLTKSRDLAILATNVNATFDVRYLSGAQSRIFAMNLLLSILPMLPERYRCNVLMLDEVDANCSIQTKAILAQEFLPRLCAIVPSVWVITPSSKNEMWTSGARELIAYKKDGRTTLREG